MTATDLGMTSAAPPYTVAPKRPFSRIGSRFAFMPTGLTTGLIAYVHPTKGVRTRRLTPQLAVALSMARAA